MLSFLGADAPLGVLPAVPAFKNTAVFVRSPLGHFVTFDSDVGASRDPDRHAAGPGAGGLPARHETAYTITRLEAKVLLVPLTRILAPPSFVELGKHSLGLVPKRR